MPRAGLTSRDVVATAAELADLRHRIATQAMSELGEAVRDALQGRSGRDALTALLAAVRAYVSAHPGRYAATIGTRFAGPDDPLLAASTRVIDSVAAALRGYGIGDAEMVHAIRTIHGFAMLREADGFQWSGEPGDTFGLDDPLHRPRPAGRSPVHGKTPRASCQQPGGVGLVLKPTPQMVPSRAAAARTLSEKFPPEGAWRPGAGSIQNLPAAMSAAVTREPGRYGPRPAGTASSAAACSAPARTARAGPRQTNGHTSPGRPGAAARPSRPGAWAARARRAVPQTAR